jgi:NADPH2:quinone reductase
VKAMRVQEVGGPEVLRIHDLPVPEPQAGQARVRLEAIGINYIDVYQRSGLYSMNLPFTPGQEGAGTVEAVGPDVSEVKVGDRVGWAGVTGSYAEQALIPAARLVPLPQGISARDAAAVLLQGMTAHYLVTSTWSLKAGESCLVHAAAGGVGLLLCRMAHNIGAHIFATVSTEEKAALAREAGAGEVIFYTRDDFEPEVRRRTGGTGVDVVFDSVGRDTFEKSLACLRPRGMLVLFGQSSGPVAPFDPQVLARKGSLFLTRPVLGHYTASRQDLLARAADLFEWMREGKLRLHVDSELPLGLASEAHRRLEARETKGKVLLIP